MSGDLGMYFKIKALYTKPRVSMLRNKMVLLNEKNRHLLGGNSFPNA
jgi:hypothetical protein